MLYGCTVVLAQQLAELGVRQYKSTPLAANKNRNTPNGGTVGQQKIEQTDRRAAMLEAFDSMSDESQIDALFMLQSIARSAPRRPPAALRLVASGSDGDGFRKPASGSQ
jgi:hypothetical protein